MLNTASCVFRRCLVLHLSMLFLDEDGYGIIKQMVQAKTKKPRHRTYAKNRPRVRIARRVSEGDGVYFLKLVIVVLLGTLWLKFATPLSWNGLPLAAFPLGALIALVVIRLYEKDQTDRKIWFAVLVMVTILSYFVPAGIVI